jgi:release factor glutamine methyltransferase
MTIYAANHQLISELKNIYDDHEAATIAALVLEHITGLQRVEQLKTKETALNTGQIEKLNQITARLKENEPVQYILEEAWFAGMKFKVNRSVLIPRPETEELVDLAVKDANAQCSVLDIGTGSGCIPIAIKKKIPQAAISAIDICSEALFTATENAMALKTAIDFRLLDFLDEEKWKELGVYDIIVSNPPYVRQQEKQNMHERVSGHEPHLALFVPDDDALLFYRKLADFSSVHLNRGGKLFVEINESFGTEVVNLFQSKGFSNIELRKDMQGKDRMVRAGK